MLFITYEMMMMSVMMMMMMSFFLKFLYKLVTWTDLSRISSDPSDSTSEQLFVSLLVI